MSEHIKVERDGRVVVVTIDRSEKKNALTQAMYGAMADAIVAYGEDAGMRAMVITGAGDMFTAGNDLFDFAMGDREKEVPDVWRFLQAIAECPKPVIAAVNGPGIGVGLTMLLHCDLVFAADEATFATPFVQLGVVPEAASSMLLPAAIGPALAGEMLLAGRVLTAPEALSAGLVSRVVPGADLMALAIEVAHAMAGAAPEAMRISKSLIRHGREEVMAHMAREAKHFAAQLQSAEFSESVAAKLQKRAPKFD